MGFDFFDRPFYAYWDGVSLDPPPAVYTPSLYGKTLSDHRLLKGYVHEPPASGARLVRDRPTG